MDIFEILKQAVQFGASDVHIVVGRPPMVRIMGEMCPMQNFEPVSPADSKNLIYSLLYDDQKARFEELLELDTSYNVPGLSRFRINVFLHKDGVGAVIRVISSVIPAPEEIGLSPEVIEVCNLPRGLVLVTGPTGSGKTTTLASLIEQINCTHREHIITLEDPIEFVYEQKLCVVTQREVGKQTLNFANALKSALRQDPDVILVGEMRDLETISLALTCAETGHLVFGTLHTTDAAQTVDRVVDVFPPYQQQQIRVQLGGALKAVICQNLLPRADGQGRAAAREIMFVTTGIANLIREGKTHQIYSAIETGGKQGMITMDKSLSQLVGSGTVKLDDALARANDAQM
ncbi:MAG: type IV pilus twitching motility protein PilT, partial [Candidatus Xenobia bacterium]